MVARAKTSPLVSEPFEQPGSLGPKGTALELSLVPLVSGAGAPPLKLALVSQSAMAGSRSAGPTPQSTWIPERHHGLWQAATKRFGLSSFLGTSPLVQSLRLTAQQAAQSDEPFMIIGSPGSGARTLAKAIHTCANPLAPLDQVQAEALPSRWLHNAMQSQASTLGQSYLVAHVDRMSMEDQASLVELKGKARLLLTASSSPQNLHPKLAQAIHDRFVVLPNLSEHMEDVPVIAQQYVAGLEGHPKLSQDAMQALMGYPWPGNVTELESCLRSAHKNAVLEKGAAGALSLERDHLPEVVLQYRFHAGRGPASEADMTLQPWQITDADPISFDVYERKAILRALESCKDNRLACARLLRLGKSTLYRKLKRLGIDTGE